MTRVFERAAIEAALEAVDLVAAMEQAFVDYSSGRAVVPPVGELLFEQPPGEVHIKYGYVTGAEYYVIKVASGFYENPTLGLTSSNGLMLVFRQQTGELLAVLLDEGLLTDQRTAAAGAVAAKYLAPAAVDCIGIIGTGIQAQLQLRHLAQVTTCRAVRVWGRSASALQAFCEHLADTDFEIVAVESVDDISGQCGLIVTATPATEPLLVHVAPGTHITAVGSDTPGKQELDAMLLARADSVVVDSRPQSESRGEVFRAVSSGALDASGVLELGEVVSGRRNARTDDEQITVADLTGVATQDMAIAAAVYRRLIDAD